MIMNIIKHELKALVLCEYSGIMREALKSQGWDVTSCDLLPTDIPGSHIIGDIFSLDFSNVSLVIAFPPCTFLTNADTLNYGNLERSYKRLDAAKFFLDIWKLDVPHICIENPRGLMSRVVRKPDQEVHPYYFGDASLKRTDLWLKNLPKLFYNLQDDLFVNKTSVVKPAPISFRIDKKSGKLKPIYSWEANNSTKSKRGHLRSVFWPFMALAMARQWTKFILNK